MGLFNDGFSVGLVLGWSWVTEWAKRDHPCLQRTPLVNFNKKGVSIKLKEINFLFLAICLCLSDNVETMENPQFCTINNGHFCDVNSQPDILRQHLQYFSWLQLLYTITCRFLPSDNFPIYIYICVTFNEGVQSCQSDRLRSEKYFPQFFVLLRRF